MMEKTNTNTVELGYFVTELDESPLRNFQALVKTIEDGVILPSEWTTVNDDGEMISIVDATLGGAQYITFTEISDENCMLWETDVHGLGFTQDFLVSQGVEPVEYLTLDDIMEHREAIRSLDGGLEVLAEYPGAYHFVRSRLRTLALDIRNDPAKQALLRARLAEHANDLRTYHEVIDEDDEMPLEWRVTQPIHFTLQDIQTVYVASTEEVDQFQLMYPDYHGAFVVLD